MKKVKKLSLKKETIAILDDHEMHSLQGGTGVSDYWKIGTSTCIVPPGGYSQGCGGGPGPGSHGCPPTPSRADNTCTRWPSDGYAC